ncbi:DUF4913 domain-containing protein [Nocardia higoensis]|uniref:DUF4913 domain-containing protein n=1 Tax=Nocardia higoensis TaxID=228599 RepID=A0ABS0DJD0_9NOCA|nr:DUF4913 domain-containing protein [Nocardia higoensis]MBF6358265.1 DUF4913 domain-containing protein [Nocardia higoensis]
MSETTNTNQTTGETAPETDAAAVIPQMDLGELLETAVARAVTASLAAKAKAIADDVVESMLTPEVLAGMRETAVLETTLALDPEPEPEPEPGTAGAAAVAETDDDGDGGEQMFASVEEFVEEYVAKLYRRDVHGRDSQLAWCPRWWDHGEVYNRMTALHRAFEALRTGETTESSLFWLVHFDPHMARILDPEGPFKYCSVQHGHNRGGECLRTLPTIAAPAGTSDAEDYTPHSTALFVPAPSVGTTRVVRTFLE